MTRSATFLMCAVLLTVPVAAQTPSSGENSGTKPDQKATSKTPPPPVTISGCVGGGKAAGDPFTITSDDGSVAYKLSGKSVRAFVGRRVTLVGNNDTRRLKIVGGLYPSPNAAAQAGAQSPAQAAVAADPLSTSAKTDQQLPEFRVRAVQTSGASCR